MMLKPLATNGVSYAVEIVVCCVRTFLPIPEIASLVLGNFCTEYAQKISTNATFSNILTPDDDKHFVANHAEHAATLQA